MQRHDQHWLAVMRSMQTRDRRRTERDAAVFLVNLICDGVEGEAFRVGCATGWGVTTSARRLRMFPLVLLHLYHRYTPKAVLPERSSPTLTSFTNLLSHLFHIPFFQLAAGIGQAQGRDRARPERAGVGGE